MPKKIFCVALTVATIYFAAVLIFVNATSAQDVWVCSDGGQDYYVLTESFVNRTQYRDNRTFSVDVKFVGATVAVHNYSFRENDGLIYFSVDGGADNFIDSDKLAARIWEFGLDFLGINYEAKYD